MQAAPIHEAFEAWAARQQWPADIAHRANLALHYLRMAAGKPLPAPLLRKLAEHVEAIRSSR